MLTFQFYSFRYISEYFNNFKIMKENKKKDQCPYDKQKDHYRHDDPAHNQKLREINKGVYDIPIEQVVEKKNVNSQTGSGHHFPFNSKGPYDKWYDINNTNQDIEGGDSSSQNYKWTAQEKMENAKAYDPSKELAERMVCDESATDKFKKDFEKVPSEQERINRQMNKTLNKIEEKRGVPDSKSMKAQNMKREGGVIDKTKEFISEGIDKAKDFISKF